MQVYHSTETTGEQRFEPCQDFSYKPSRLLLTYNSSTQEQEACPHLEDQPGLHGNVLASQNYAVRPCLKQTKKLEQKKRREALPPKPSIENT